MSDSSNRALPITVAKSGDPKSSNPAADDRHVSPRRILGAYKQMLAYLFIAALLVIGALLLLIVPFYLIFLSDPTNPQKAAASSVFGTVLLAGSLGALFSAIIRLYNFEDLPKALVAQELEGLPGIYLLIYSIVPMVVGAISAAVIYLVFAGKLLTGNLMPEFDCKDACTTFLGFVTYWAPKAPEDFAKILVWGFIAGFAERFVPDTLRTFVRSSEARTNSQETQSAEDNRKAGA